MKILVTGATGFIGKNLVKKLVSENAGEVLCTVRPESDRLFLAGLGVSFAIADVTDFGTLNRVVQSFSPEVVFHSAAKVMARDEDELIRINAGGTQNVCRACYENNVKKLVHVSSIAVINGNRPDKLRDDMPYMATNAYGRSKIEAERIVMGFREKGLASAVIRPCMVYGPGEPHMLDRILDAVRKRFFLVPGIPQAEAKLQLASVDNVAGCLTLAMKKDEALEGAFMVADREVLTIKGFLETLYALVGSGRPYVVPGWICRLLLSLPGLNKFNSYFKDRTYDISRAEKLLGYEPAVRTEDGLKAAVEDWKKRRAIK